MKRFKKIILKNHFWLSIEGTDGVGKTTLLEKIEKFLNNQKKINFAIIKEFSNSPVGTLIRNIISKKKFFCLGNKLHYSFSETLLLCADFVYQFEEILSKHSDKKKLFIISDRGPYSFLTYQNLRIKRQYQIHNLNYLEGWIKDIFQPLGSPNFIILLTSPIADIKKRVRERDGIVKRSELSFIQKVQKEYLKIFKETSNPPHLILENRDGNFEYVEREAIKKIKEIIGKIQKEKSPH